MQAHEIDFEIHGSEMQYVTIELDPNESVVAEAGAMMMMDRGIAMETVFGDGSGQTKGVFGSLLNAGKRLVTGESLFMTVFSNQAGSRKSVSFAAPYPGKIISFDLRKYNNKIICEKDAFLCAAKGISVGIDFQRKLGTGLFGGEGFIMQKIEGDGLAFCQTGGTVIERELKAGEELLVDTGCLVALTSSITYDVEMVKGIKSIFFGGEGLFFARLTGPGRVWIQSLPFSRLADRILANAPKQGGSTLNEGSSILGGLGRILDGDN